MSDYDREGTLAALRWLLATPTPDIGGTIRVQRGRETTGYPWRPKLTWYRWENEAGHFLEVRVEEYGSSRYFKREESGFGILPHHRPVDLSDSHMTAPAANPDAEVLAWKAIAQEHGLTVAQLDSELAMYEYPEKEPEATADAELKAIEDAEIAAIFGDAKEG
jgi:hypothetical protein